MTDRELADIADFDPVYRGAGDYDSMCYTVAELQALAIPEERIWTLLEIDHADDCEDDDEDGCQCETIVWAEGYHYVNRLNGPRSYLYTRQAPPENTLAEAYIFDGMESVDACAS